MQRGLRTQRNAVLIKVQPAHAIDAHRLSPIKLVQSTPQPYGQHRHLQPPRAPLRCATHWADWLLAPAPLARCEEARKEEPFSKILDDAAAGKVQAVRVGADRCEITLKSGRSYDAKHVPWLGTDWLATRF